ncbi:hypothetical protein ACHAWF_009751 [Thalassiosira exigua]
MFEAIRDVTDRTTGMTIRCTAPSGEALAVRHLNLDRRQRREINRRCANSKEHPVKFLKQLRRNSCIHELRFHAIARVRDIPTIRQHIENLEPGLYPEVDLQAIIDVLRDVETGNGGIGGAQNGRGAPNPPAPRANNGNGRGVIARIPHGDASSSDLSIFSSSDEDDASSSDEDYVPPAPRANNGNGGGGRDRGNGARPRARNRGRGNGGGGRGRGRGARARNRGRGNGGGGRGGGDEAQAQARAQRRARREAGGGGGGGRGARARGDVAGAGGAGEGGGGDPDDEVIELSSDDDDDEDSEAGRTVVNLTRLSSDEDDANNAADFGGDDEEEEEDDDAEVAWQGGGGGGGRGAVPIVPFAPIPSANAPARGNAAGAGGAASGGGGSVAAVAVPSVQAPPAPANDAAEVGGGIHLGGDGDVDPIQDEDEDEDEDAVDHDALRLSDRRRRPPLPAVVRPEVDLAMHGLCRSSAAAAPELVLAEDESLAGLAEAPCPSREAPDGSDDAAPGLPRSVAVPVPGEFGAMPAPPADVPPVVADDPSDGGWERTIPSVPSASDEAEGRGGATAAAESSLGVGGPAADGPFGCTVEVFPVEVFPVQLRYAVVVGIDEGRGTRGERDGGAEDGEGGEGDGDASDKFGNGDLGERGGASFTIVRRGAALASRSSAVRDVLWDLERAAAPDAGTSCVRLWRRSPAARGEGGDGPSSSSGEARGAGGGGGGLRGPRAATARGDGYDLLDLATLSPPPLTLERWLGLDPVASPQPPPRALDLLVELRSDPSRDWVRGPLELDNRLQVGDFVDAQDLARKLYEAIVLEIKPDTVKVHYFSWSSGWDAELPRREGSAPSKNDAFFGSEPSRVNSQAFICQLSPPVPLWTKTDRWRERIKEGDEVEVRQSSSPVQWPKWHRATVVALGEETDARRALEGEAELELFEEDDTERKAPLMLLNRRRQVLVEVPKEPSHPRFLPRTDSVDGDDSPVAYLGWVNLYGEEIRRVNSHKKTTDKNASSQPATLNYTMESKRRPVEVMKPCNNIHGPGFVREYLRGMPPAEGTVGLHNLGNSCYMNSILQCMNHIKPIVEYFLKGEYLREINGNNPLGSGGWVAMAYASFLNEIYSGEYSILAPRLMKQIVGLFAPQFNNNDQHDSQEFYQYLMGGLHEDLNRVKDKPHVEHTDALGMQDSVAAMESWRKYLLRNDSVFVDFTHGLHRSHINCPSCGKESVKFDVYSSLYLPLVPPGNRPSISLKDCLDQFAAGEQLDEHNAWYCSNCKKDVCALKQIDLWNTPDIIVLNLNRFTFEKKIKDRVDFPIDRLDLSSYLIGPRDPDAPPVYKLFGVSEHSGSTAHSGHYTATVRNSEDGNWYRYNDSHVGTTSGDAAVTGGAYLLFYQRAKGSLRWAGMEKQMAAAAAKQNNDGDAAQAEEDKMT